MITMHMVIMTVTTTATMVLIKRMVTRKTTSAGAGADADGGEAGYHDDTVGEHETNIGS